MIGWKNPDFINTNGEKICIEIRNRKVVLYLDKISLEEYKEKRISHFSKYGWKCIVLFDDSMNDEKSLLETLRNIGGV